jgi:hypothetical protein
MALQEWDGIFCVHGIGEGKEDQIVPSNSEFFLMTYFQPCLSL